MRLGLTTLREIDETLRYVKGPPTLQGPNSLDTPLHRLPNVSAFTLVSFSTQILQQQCMAYDRT